MYQCEVGPGAGSVLVIVVFLSGCLAKRSAGGMKSEIQAAAKRAIAYSLAIAARRFARSPGCC
jgi:hypothetical protein